MLIIVLAVILIVLAAWVSAVDGLYPLPAPRPTRLSASTADGWTLAVWYRPAVHRRFSHPVVLCPGLANNAAFFDFVPPQSLAAFLSDRGFDCYTVDLRGAGGSRPLDTGPWEVSVDDYIHRDVPAIAELVERHSGSRSLLWVGHSMGGLIGLAASSLALHGRLAGLVTIGSPVYFHSGHGLRPFLRLAQWLSPWGAFDTTLIRFVAPLAGRVAARLPGSTNLANVAAVAQRFAAANIFAPMFRGVLRQLEDWATNDAFRSEDLAIDYRAAATRLEAPLLVMGGSVDQLAPEPAMQAYFELMRASVHPRAIALFGRSHGQLSEYGHGDLVVGQRAHLEVYPVVAEFLERCASASGGATAVDQAAPG